MDAHITAFMHFKINNRAKKEEFYLCFMCEAWHDFKCLGDFTFKKLYNVWGR